MTGDLVQFLRARLDERQRVAEDAAAMVRRWPKDNPAPWDRARLVVAKMQDEFGGHARRAVALDAFEGRESPAEVLADVAAKRAILDAWDAVRAEPDGSNEEQAGRESALYNAASLLVQPYAGHLDFDPAWTVEVSA